RVAARLSVVEVPVGGQVGLGEVVREGLPLPGQVAEGHRYTRRLYRGRAAGQYRRRGGGGGGRYRGAAGVVARHGRRGTGLLGNRPYDDLEDDPEDGEDEQDRGDGTEDPADRALRCLGRLRQGRYPERSDDPAAGRGSGTPGGHRRVR